jgi:hypothetical protein
MFTPSRDQARRFFFDTWAKHRAGAALAGLETTALAVMLLHPEYHSLLDDRERNLDRDFGPDQGGLNPFLHLSLHLAVEEQLAIDQPPGIASAYRALVAELGNEHEARHVVLECLGETLWTAQRNAAPPDGAAYVQCIERQLRIPPTGLRGS